jgi:hypothetical protein
VYDFILLHGFEGLADFPENEQSFLFWQLSIVFLNVLVKTAAVAVFQENVKIIRRLSNIEHFYDKLTV